MFTLGLWLVSPVTITLQVFTALVVAWSLLASLPSRQEAQPEDPQSVELCALRSNPGAWNAKRITVGGLVTQDFEHFTIAAPCGSDARSPEVWLTYGGHVPSGTIYCCPGEGETAERSRPLTIDGLVLPLVRDARFEQFTTALKRKRPARARAVLVGTFFAKEHAGLPALWGGFGHMGAYTLLVVERVREFALQ